mgnify:CR=1 FL=1
MQYKLIYNKAYSILVIVFDLCIIGRYTMNIITKAVLASFLMMNLANAGNYNRTSCNLEITPIN